MAKITFIERDGVQKTVEAPIGHSVMEIAVRNNIDTVEGACGGSLACATCHLYVHPDWATKALGNQDDKTEEEEDMLDVAFEVRDCSRLTCQIEMTEDLDGLILAVPGSNVDWD